MAAAIPAAIGLGGSLIGGIQGKGAAKKQEKLAKEQMEMLRPLLQAQISGSQFALGQSKPFLDKAGSSLTDLLGQYQTLASGNRTAMDQYLAPEIRAINQGYRSASQNLMREAPRGGGRVSSLARADIDRQGKIADLIYGARRQARGDIMNVGQLLGGLGTSTLSAGLGGGNQAYSLLGQQQNRAYDARNQSGAAMGELGQSLGGFLGQLFDSYGKKGGSSSGGSMGGGSTGGSFGKF